MGSILEIYPASKPEQLTPIKSLQESQNRVADIWENVGKRLQNAMNQVDKEIQQDETKK